MTSGRVLWLVVCCLMVAGAASGDELATTDNGLRVLLHNDGTWEPVGQDVIASPILLELLDVRWVESGPGNDFANDYRDWISLGFRVHNETDRTIRAAQGTVVITDLFGNQFISFRATFNDSVAPGDSYDWTGKIDYDMFSDAHRRLKGQDADDLLVDFVDVQTIDQAAQEPRSQDEPQSRR